jgi:hypothetical protein
MAALAIRHFKNLTAETYANMTLSKKRYEVDYWRQYENLMRSSILAPNTVNNTEWYNRKASVDRWKLMVTFECVESYMNASLKATDTEGKYTWVEPSIGVFLAEMRKWRESQNGTANSTLSSSPSPADGIAEVVPTPSSLFQPIKENGGDTTAETPPPKTSPSTASTRPRFPFSEHDDLSFLHKFTRMPIDDDSSAMMYLIRTKMEQWEPYKWSIGMGTAILVYWGYGMVRVHTTRGFDDLIYDAYRYVFG